MQCSLKTLSGHYAPTDDCPGYIRKATYEEEPPRRKELIVNCKEPFNAETRPDLLPRSFYVPNDLFFVRNHAAVPVLKNEEEYRLQVEGFVSSPLLLSLKDLKTKFKKHSICAVLQCAGNRRTELSRLKKIDGVPWLHGAAGNATWSGVLLSHILKAAGVDQNQAKHVEFEGADLPPEEETGKGYLASIPLSLALNEADEVIVAYEMNGQVLSRDHGYPLRVIVPGFVGARSVKWLSRIICKSKPSDGYFMTKDYKYLPSDMHLENVDWSSTPPIMNLSVQCAICDPLTDSKLAEGYYRIRGYALTGGGHHIMRVEVIMKDSQEWIRATLLKPEKKSYKQVSEEICHGIRNWSWTLWEATLYLKPPVSLVARAVDSACNTQPEYPLWNVRGVMNNAWHHINIYPLQSSL
eukprot:jgi/Galph1/178/GphlegSOOS_G4950.1